MAPRTSVILNSVNFSKNPWKPLITKFYTPTKKVFKPKPNTDASSNFCRLYLLFPSIPATEICSILEANDGNLIKALDILLLVQFIRRPKEKTNKQRASAARCMPLYLNLVQENNFVQQLLPSIKMKNYKWKEPQYFLPNIRFAGQQEHSDSFYNIDNMVLTLTSGPSGNSDLEMDNSDIIDVENEPEDVRDPIKMKLLRSGNQYSTQML